MPEQPERQVVVGGPHAAATVDDAPSGPAARRPRSKSARSASASLNVPSGFRVAVHSTFAAPGMWPPRADP